MSIIDRKTVTCSVCGHKQTVRYARSLFGAGSPELDGKPPWLLRSSMPVWVHKCHRCGFAAYCLEGGDRSLRMFIVSPAYVFCEGKPLLFPLAVKFYQQGILALRQGETLSAYHAFLHAAWACDDRHNLPGAVSCRRKAAALYSGLEKEAQNNSRLLLTQVDLLRRTGQFSAALQLLDAEEIEEERLLPYVRFERTLISQKDRKGHSTRDVELEKRNAVE